MPLQKWPTFVICGLGGFITIAVLHLLTADFKIVACLIIPFAASCALVFGVPTSSFSQPRNVMIGHLLSALIGLTVFKAFGQDTWWTEGLATGAAIVAMLATNNIHPPAAATALLSVAMRITDFVWAFVPVTTGAAIIVAIGIVYNNTLGCRRYPLRWW